MKKIKDLFKENDFDKKYNSNSQRFSGKKTFSKEADIFDFLELINGWEGVVGPRLVEQTIPLKLKNKSLTILTNHPVYAQQLSFMEAAIIKKIESSFPPLKGSIRKIFFQADNKHFALKRENIIKKSSVKQEHEKKWHKHSPEYKKFSKEAEDRLDGIEDDELKESLKSIYLQLKKK